MKTHADKTQENKSQSVANEDSQKQSGSESAFRFVDNRPEAVAQRKLQDIANNSLQAKKAAQLQAMADDHSAQQQWPSRKKNSAEKAAKEGICAAKIRQNWIRMPHHFNQFCSEEIF